jgi:hypothetical protein
MTVRLCIAITETKYFNNRTISQKQSQFNAVFLTQKEMDRVGFEPTTSAMCRDFIHLSRTRTTWMQEAHYAADSK